MNERMNKRMEWNEFPSGELWHLNLDKKSHTFFSENKKSKRDTKGAHLLLRNQSDSMLECSYWNISTKGGLITLEYLLRFFFLALNLKFKYKVCPM